MDEALILETTFLIDFERERRCLSGPAVSFLKRHLDSRLFITHTIAGELAAGKSLSDRERWQAFISPFRILPWNLAVDWEYAQAFRFLQANGLMIGTNDLWIGATALAHQLPVVTRNAEHYRRIPGLKLLDYT